MKSLTKNSIYNAMHQVLNIVFPLISSIYVARVLMPEGVGRVAYAQNIASYFATAAALGIPTVGLRAIAVARDDKRELNKSFSELFVLNSISTTIVLVSYVVLVFGLPSFRANYSLFLATGMMVAFNYINIDWLFQGNEEYVYIVTRNTIVKVVSLGALFLFVRSQNDYVLYAVIATLGWCGNYVLNVFHAKKYVRITLSNLEIRRYVKPIVILSGSLFLNAIYSKLDTTMLGVMCGEENVGYYSYAHKIFQVGISFCTAVTAAFLPRLSYYFQNNKSEFYRLVDKGMEIVAFLAFPAAVGLYVLAPEAVSIMFGEVFLPAAQTLRILSILIIVFAYGNLLCYQMMLCSGTEKRYVLILAFAAIINIVLNSVMIPIWKHDGAAVASVCTELFINIVAGMYYKNKIKLQYKWKPIKDAVLSTSVMGLCLLLLKNTLDRSVMSLAVCICVSVGIYVMMNMLWKNQFTFTLLAMIKRNFGSR